MGSEFLSVLGAVATGLPITNEKMLSPTSWALPHVLWGSWGSASLHPRLYAIAALRGLKANCDEIVQAFQ